MLVKFKVNDTGIKKQLFANGVDLEGPYEVRDWTSTPLRVASICKLSGEEFTTNVLPVGTKVVLVADKKVGVRVKRARQLYFETDIAPEIAELSTSVVAPRRLAPGYNDTPRVVITLAKGVAAEELVGRPMLLLQLAEQGV